VDGMFISPVALSAKLFWALNDMTHTPDRVCSCGKTRNDTWRFVCLWEVVSTKFQHYGFQIAEVFSYFGECERLLKLSGAETEMPEPVRKDRPVQRISFNG
jgi:hypothetical protein